MADIEKKDIEVGAWWWTAEKTDYKKVVEWLNKEKWWDEEAEKAKKQAAELLKQIPWMEWKEVKTEIHEETHGQLPPWYEKEINQRSADPKVQEGITWSILNTIDVINNKSIDKKENRFARQIGKAMNLLFPPPTEK